MEPTKLNVDKKVLSERRGNLEDLLKRRFFYTPSYQIYQNVAGLFDYGPPGCAVKTNVEQLWREFFVLEDDMLEIAATNLTIEKVLHTSGHVERFNDLLVRDVKTSEGFRADKLLCEFIEKTLEKEGAKLSKEKKDRFNELLRTADCLKAEEMGKVFKELNIKSPTTGNEFTDPIEFNLMFGTHIGPTGKEKAFLRPETAQGIFVNFRKLIEYNGGRMPFACAQLGLGFRNEIAPRSGLLRVREFQMAEIEHFVDPTNKNHPKFANYAHHKLPLYSQDCQYNNKDPVRDMTLGDAVKAGIINNETLAYFICRTYLFLVACGINPNNIRFRQHLKDEMAHYASDCWDAEIETSYGWVECVGIADRSCFDLERHAKVSGVELVAARKFTQPRNASILQMTMEKGKMGKEFKEDNKALQAHLEGLNEEGRKALKAQFDSAEHAIVNVNGKDLKISKEMLKFEQKDVIIMEEKFVPNVIEPSFGIGRIIYAIFEHCFKMRDQKRTYIDFPPKIAPIKCAIFPVISTPEFKPYIEQVRSALKRLAISCKVDDGGSSIGRRYARTDEIGIPFAITIDEDTPKNKDVTLRELNTLKQVRIPIEGVGSLLWDLVEGNVTWEDVTKKFPAFVLKEDDEKDIK